MIPKPKDSNELFVQLRTFAERFQCLHELHVDHFKKWPYAVDPNVDKSVAKVDFDTKTFIYEWTFKTKLEKRPKDYQYRLQELCKGIGFLLGPGWKIKIQNLVTQETIFTSEDVSGITKKPREPKRNSSKQLANRRRKKRSR